MKIPNKIKILHLDYDVVEDRNIHDGKNELFGQVQYLEQKILLNENASVEGKCETLLHEAIHAIDNVFSIGLEEKQVNQLGVALYNFLKDNQKVLFNND